MEKGEEQEARGRGAVGTGPNDGGKHCLYTLCQHTVLEDLVWETERGSADNVVAIMVHGKRQDYIDLEFMMRERAI